MECVIGALYKCVVVKCIPRQGVLFWPNPDNSKWCLQIGIVTQWMEL